MTADEVRNFFCTNGDYRFKPACCRAAGVSVIETKFLKCLLLAERDNRWVQANFSLGLAYKLARRGLVENPLGVPALSHALSAAEGAAEGSGNNHTNLWRLTEQGLQALSAAVGGGA